MGKIKILNKCPVCGGRLEYNLLYQYTKIFGIKKNGELTKKKLRQEDNGPLECGFISCENADFITDCDLNIAEPKNIGIRVFQNRDKLCYEEIEE